MPLRVGSPMSTELLGGRHVRVLAALSIGLSMAYACGGVVETRNGGNTDFVGDASVGGSSKASGGTAIENGGRGPVATGGARANGGVGSGGIGTSGGPGNGGFEVGGAF